MTGPRTLLELLDRLNLSDHRVVFPETGTELAHRDVPGLAHAFAGELGSAGVGGGDVVGILVPTGPEWLPAFFGVQAAGAVASVLPLPPVLVDPAAAARRLAPLVAAGRIRHLVAADVGAEVAARLAALDPGLVVLDAAGIQLASPAGRRPSGGSGDPAAPAVVQFSSGSTARPKGILLSHGAVLSGVLSINERLGSASGDVLVQWIPLFHDMGLVALLCALATPADAHLLRTATFVRDPARLLTYLAEVRGSIVTGPNFSYDWLSGAAATCGLDASALSGWRVALNGAETVRPQSVASFAAALGPFGVRPSTMLPCYGLAEATLAVTVPVLGAAPRCLTVDRDKLAIGDAVAALDQGAANGRGLVSLGAPVPGLRLTITGVDGRALPDGHVGEVLVQGPSLFTGYLDDPEATADALRNGWLHTGDLGFTHGGELFIVGRIKEMIVVRGRNFYPDDVEDSVRDVPGIHRGNCVAVTRPETETIVLVAESRAHADEAGRADVAQRIRGRVADAFGSAAIEVVLVAPRALPRTTSGKWQRSRVRDMVVERGATAPSPSARE